MDEPKYNIPIPGPGVSTKLTKSLTKKLCEKLRKTLPIEKACDLVGLARQTYYNWERRGEEGEEPFVTFLGAVRQARAEAQEYWLDVCANSTIDKSVNPAAAFFVLERSDRANWGREVKVEPKSAEVTPDEILRDLGNEPGA